MLEELTLEHKAYENTLLLSLRRLYGFIDSNQIKMMGIAYVLYNTDSFILILNIPFGLHNCPAGSTVPGNFQRPFAAAARMAGTALVAAGPFLAFAKGSGG